jgi:hypothetical protein
MRHQLLLFQEEMVNLHRAQLQDLCEDKAEDSEERGSSLMNRKIRGAKEFLSLVRAKDDAKKSRLTLEKDKRRNLSFYAVGPYTGGELQQAAWVNGAYSES